MLEQNQRLIEGLRDAIARVEEYERAGRVAPGGWMLLGDGSYCVGPAAGPAPLGGAQLPFAKVGR